MTSPAQRYVEVLARAVPRGDAREVPERTLGGTIARAELYGRTVMYAYLDDHRSARLRIFPGDTLGQARILYADPRRTRRLMELGEWEIEPNFHFGYREPGLCWLKSRWHADEYIAYWLANIGHTRELPRAEMRKELERLVGVGMFEAGVLRQFDAEVGRRPRAAPRPGLWLTCHLSRDASLDELVEDVRTALRHALSALEEPLDVLALP